MAALQPAGLWRGAYPVEDATQRRRRCCRLVRCGIPTNPPHAATRSTPTTCLRAGGVRGQPRGRVAVPHQGGEHPGTRGCRLRGDQLLRHVVAERSCPLAWDLRAGRRSAYARSARGGRVVRGHVHRRRCASARAGCLYCRLGGATLAGKPLNSPHATASGALSGNIVLEEGTGQPAAMLTCYVASLLVVLVGLFFVGRWPACLGDGNEECSLCTSRLRLGRGLRAEKAAGEQTLLKADPEAPTVACWRWQSVGCCS